MSPEYTIHEATYEGYTLSTDRRRIDRRVVWKFLSEDSYWARGISLDRVTRALENSMNLGVFTPDGGFAAFGQVVTDYAIFAYLRNVFCLPAHRGKGLASWMAREIRHHPELAGVTTWMLSTSDAHAVYERAGFQRAPHPGNYMTVPKRTGA